jgi:hypothetical protein
MVDNNKDAHQGNYKTTPDICVDLKLNEGIY